jgi:SpoU rRNA methylase family enzyme
VWNAIAMVTDLVGICLVVASEVGGTPAVDGVPHVLGGGDEHSEDDEEESSVAVMDAVNDVVIIARTRLGYLAYSRNETVSHTSNTSAINSCTTGI